MSQENVELHRRSVAAIGARVFFDEPFEELCASEFRMENTSTAVTDKTYYGAEGVRERIAEFFEAFDEDARHEIEEIVADGNDFVVSVVRFVGRGARSEAPLVLRLVGVTWLDKGKMTRAVGYPSRRQALDAVGLAGRRCPGTAHDAVGVTLDG
jgi:ketosteroid isomerase-like protein